MIHGMRLYISDDFIPLITGTVLTYRIQDVYVMGTKLVFFGNKIVLDRVGIKVLLKHG